MNAVHRLLTDHIDIWTGADTAPKSGRGRAAKNAGSVYGIKRLRELILELAMRGKLVPQDQNDEPAIELLKRIQEEKKSLFVKGKLKKEKSPPAFASDEVPFDLPEGWEWTTFGEIYSLEYGDNLPAERRTNSGEYPVYGSNGIVGSHNVCFVFSPCIIVGRKGSAGALNLCLSDGCCVTDVAYYCVPSQHIDLLFSFKLFHTLELDSLGKGIKPGLNRNEAYAIPIAVPPFAEQHRIVAKVDELMALCDQLEAQHVNAVNAHEKLVSHLLGALTDSQNDEDFGVRWQRIAVHFDTVFTTEASIASLKNTLLQIAVMGKLTPQNSSDESAGMLFERIRAAKELLTPNKKSSKDKPRIPISETEKPFRLPAGWQWVKISEITELITSGSRDWARYLSNDGAKFITMSNLSRGSYELRLENIRYVSPPLSSEGARTKLQPDDLLVSITGDVGNLGRIPENFGEAYINQHTGLLRFIPLCRNRYFPEVLRSPLAVSQFNAPQRGIKNSFRLSDLGGVVIPLPPINEQARIVGKIDELFSLADKLIEKLNEAESLRCQIANVLVAKALHKMMPPHPLPDQIAHVKPEQAVSNQIERKYMPTNFVSSVDDLVKCITDLGGSSMPEDLLSKTRLGEDVETFYHLLREGRATKRIKVELGSNNLIQAVDHEN